MITKKTARSRKKVWSRQRGEGAWGEEMEWEDTEREREREGEKRME